MARGVRLKFNPAKFDDILNSDAALELVTDKAESIADACNSDSSWGGYFTSSAKGSRRARARVWAADGRSDENRDQRLLRNLDA